MLIYAQDTNLTAVKRAFEAAGLLKDVPLAFNPSVLLGVTYYSSKTGQKALHAGIKMSPTETYSTPIFNIVGDPGAGPFIIAVIDPDAYSRARPIISEVRHFLSGFYSLDRVSGLLLPSTLVGALTPYHYPVPFVDSGLHRYAFYLFRQSVEFAEQTLITSTSSVRYFNLTNFAAKMNLGNPIGGTFMFVGPDPS
ncbi:hypothetical protein NLJ89_g11956 [Agrocybe chaxingu]|uniref:Uncharacterized protein n=1 Tax=Agrocybe chaxingu TaxID=84603 RepID=A0A9W8JN88_9AGAR|nr:hypothetical protein NLJ89_g11956 [Agrocybe chaxingu]